MTGIVACVPTIGLSPYLDDLVWALLAAGVRTRLYVNSEDVPENLQGSMWAWPRGDLVELVHCPDETIYTEWNAAACWASAEGAHLLCVTDDVVISPRVPGELAAALDARPDHGLVSTDVTCGPEDFAPVDVTPTSHKQGNRYAFATWCFMARAAAWQDVDPRYRIWYGDDDLILKVNESGWKVGYLQGVGVTHHTSTTSNQVPWVAEAAGKDGVLWASIHP